MVKLDMRHLKRAPSPHHVKYTKFISVMIVVFAFSVLVYIGSVSYTGFAVNEGNSVSYSENQNILLNSHFEVLEIEKSPNSVLSFNLNSELNLNLFAEVEDCEYWLNGKDKDNSVIYAINSINSGDFKIGDPSMKTSQQIQLYQTDYLCLVLINREYPKSGNVNLKYSEIENNKWTIV